MRSTILWISIFVSVIILAQLLGKESEPTKQFTYTEFVEHINQEKIASGTIIDRKYFYGELKQEEFGTINNVETSYKKFVVTLPPTIDSEMLNNWESHGIEYTFKEDQNRWMDYFFQMLPWLLLILFWFFMMRRMQGGANRNIFSFGKSHAQVISNENPEVTFNDVAGCDEAKEELREIVSFLKNPKKFQRLGGKIPRGALLLGPPGTGKTLLARAVAGEAGVPFYSLSGADFVEMFVGVGASRVRDLFEQGKKNAPCIIFIDEIDAVGRQRGAGLGGGHDEREQTLNALLVEMDGFEVNDNVILIAATNRPDVLDAALLRPGRFDRQIVVDTPDVRGREGILKVHTQSKPLSKDVDLKIIAKGTPGMSGADLANLVNEASLLASRKNRRSITMVDFEEAKDKLLMGIERRSMVINEEERRTTAIHEAGHALVAKLTKGADPVHKVTIIPRGRALGLTAQLPMDDRHNYSRDYIEGMLAILMGGRAAEQIILSQLTTGAGNDLERATGLARKMVCEWGMSDKMGPMTFGQKQEEIFIGREFGMHRDFSEELAHEIDEEVRSILLNAKKTAEDIIQKHKKDLLTIADLLLERESVDGREIDLILDGKPVPPPKSNNNRSPNRRGRKHRSGSGSQTTSSSSDRATSGSPQPAGKPSEKTETKPRQPNRLEKPVPENRSGSGRQIDSPAKPSNDKPAGNERTPVKNQADEKPAREDKSSSSGKASGQEKTQDSLPSTAPFDSKKSEPVKGAGASQSESTSKGVEASEEPSKTPAKPPASRGPAKINEDNPEGDSKK
ncbi:MAG: ATP-dependent zinc metalloprotease FtsH [Lentisphaeria bacterium]|nr:ATP-dependent zinc metalloprotease FtsH [Candidatus Neomarinimicrobiota bacterium]MCF7841539.1 ATP-dependent zinc metalloprotease FtsH [Lentisphaeria bacterium]